MENLRLKLLSLIEELERETSGRHMNDAEYSRWRTLDEILDLIEDEEASK